MTTYGLTPSGFKLKRYIDIMNDIQTKLNIPLVDADGEVSSGIGQLIQPFALNLSEAWEVLQDQFRNQDPNNAEDIHLDNVLALNNMERLSALQSKAIIGVHHVDNVSSDPTFAIDQDFLIESNADSERFIPEADTSLTNENVSLMYFQILSLVDSTVYGVVINGIEYTATYTLGQSLNDIIQSIVDDINGAGINIVGTNIASEKGFSVASTDVTFTITPYTNDTTMLYPINYISVNSGTINSFAGTLTEIVTPIAEIDFVYNLQDGTPGRNIEEDGEARIRREIEKSTANGGSLPNIISYLRRTVPGIISISGRENKKDIIVDGLDPHSIELTIQGGDLQEIGEALYIATCGGIDTQGNTTITILDTEGLPLDLYIVRPEVVYGWINIEINTFDAEENLPSNWQEEIKEKCLEIGKTFDTGKDVYGQIFSPAPLSVEGIAEVTVTVDVTENPGDTPVYENVAIVPSTQLAIFDNDRINIVTP